MKSIKFEIIANYTRVENSGIVITTNKVAAVRIVRDGLSFSYCLFSFLFYFDLVFIFLFLELKVRVSDGHKS